MLFAVAVIASTYPLYLLMTGLRRSREASCGVIQLAPGIEEE
jgi:hypothetical protein